MEKTTLVYFSEKSLQHRFFGTPSDFMVLNSQLNYTFAEER